MKAVGKAPLGRQLKAPFLGLPKRLAASRQVLASPLEPVRPEQPETETGELESVATAPVAVVMRAEVLGAQSRREKAKSSKALML